MRTGFGATGPGLPAANGGSRQAVPVPEHLTAAQHEQLIAELADLEGPKRAEVVEAIRVARGHGDLSENFEYHAAKNEQGLLERRITMLRDRLHDAVIVEAAGTESG